MRRAVLPTILALLCGCGAEERPRLADSDPVVVLPGATLDRRSYLGSILFKRYCTICHGDKGAGDGFNSFNLDPKPSDLRGATDEMGLAHVQRVILEGSAAVGKSPLCPPRGNTLTDEEADLVLAFLGSLEKPVPEAGS